MVSGVKYNVSIDISAYRDNDTQRSYHTGASISTSDKESLQINFRGYKRGPRCPLEDKSLILKIHEPEFNLNVPKITLEGAGAYLMRIASTPKLFDPNIRIVSTDQLTYNDLEWFKDLKLTRIPT